MTTASSPRNASGLPSPQRSSKHSTVIICDLMTPANDGPSELADLGGGGLVLEIAAEPVDERFGQIGVGDGVDLGAQRWPKAATLMDEAKSEVLAFRTFPHSHWRKIWSTNPLERVNKEIKCRSRVVGIFPNEASAIRLVGAVLADLHDDWIASDRRYFSEASMAKLYPERDDATTVTAKLETGD